MTNSAPFFSIVVPTYNRSEFIGRAIQSVLDQRFPNFELIIVDDGSTDETQRIVRVFNDPRIKYFYKENEERSIARNYGIKQCSGKYLNFLDSDDFFHPHHLATAYRHLAEKNYPELLHSEFEIRLADGVAVPKERIDGRSINQRLIYANILNGGSFFIRRDLLTTCTFISHKDATISEDWYLWLRLAARFPIHFVDCVTHVVMEHDQRSLRRVDPVKVERSLLLVIAELKQDSAVMNYYNSSFPYFVSECYSLIALNYASVNKTKTITYLFRSIYAHAGIVKRRRFLAILKNLIFHQRMLRP